MWDLSGENTTITLSVRKALFGTFSYFKKDWRESIMSNYWCHVKESQNRFLFLFIGLQPINLAANQIESHKSFLFINLPSDSLLSARLHFLTGNPL